jgi:hypothetical protein
MMVHTVCSGGFMIRYYLVLFGVCTQCLDCDMDIDSEAYYFGGWLDLFYFATVVSQEKDGLLFIV